MKKELRVEGTAFTRRRREWITYEVSNEEDMSAWGDRMEKMVEWSKDPWAAQLPRREWIKRCLVEEQASAGGRKFKAREDMGWYLQELQMAGRLVDKYVADGNAKWAAFEGARFGELWSELQLKLAREELFLLGKKQKEASDEGVARWRRGKQIERVQEVDARPADTPKSLVFRRIAKRECVTVKAIEADYYKAKKNSPKPHD